MVDPVLSCVGGTCFGGMLALRSVLFHTRVESHPSVCFGFRFHQDLMKKCDNPMAVMSTHQMLCLCLFVSFLRYFVVFFPSQGRLTLVLDQPRSR